VKGVRTSNGFVVSRGLCLVGCADVRAATALHSCEVLLPVVADASQWLRRSRHSSCYQCGLPLIGFATEPGPHFVLQKHEQGVLIGTHMLRVRCPHVTSMARATAYASCYGRSTAAAGPASESCRCWGNDLRRGACGRRCVLQQCNTILRRNDPKGSVRLGQSITAVCAWDGTCCMDLPNTAYGCMHERVTVRRSCVH
jgi:hypothetical protein